MSPRAPTAGAFTMRAGQAPDKSTRSYLSRRPRDAELDALVAELRAAGLLTIGTDAQGRETWTPTPKGTQVANQLAMNAEDGQAVLDALLDATEADTT